MDTNVIEMPWLEAKDTIQKILLDKQPFANYSIPKLLLNAFNKRNKSHTENDYDGLRDLIAEHLEKNVRATIVNTSSDSLFHVLCNIWDDFQSSIDYICRNLFFYDPRVFISNPSQKIISKISNGLFSDLIFYHGNILDTIRAQVLSMLNDDRAGKKVNRGQLKKILTIMMSIKHIVNVPTSSVIDNPNLFKYELKHTIFNDFSTFTDVEGKKLMETSANVLAYINAVEPLIAQEEYRIKYFFDEKTQIELESIITINLVELNIDAIMKKHDLRCMMKNKEYEHLAYLYNFLNNNNALKSLIKYFNLYVCKLGKFIKRNINKNNTNFIQGLMHLNSSCYFILVNCFKNDFRLKYFFVKYIRNVVETNPMVEKYLKVLVMDKLKTVVNSLEINSYNDNAVVEAMKLYDYLENKDSIENSLQRFFAKMLFKKFSQSFVPNNTLPMRILPLLKHQCSHEFMKKVYNMIQVVNINNITDMDEFKQHVVHSKPHLLTSVNHFNALLLNKAYLPTFNNITCNLPLELSTIYDNFKDFCLTQKHRCLTLLPKYGLISLKAVFYSSPQSDDKSLTSVSPNKYTIEVSTLQACVLLLFNNCDQLTLENILDETNIPINILINVIQTLLTSLQCQILIKNPQCATFQLTDKFCINEAFTTDSNKVKLYSQSTKLNSVVKEESNNENMDQTSDMLIELSIVRIMKLEKKMTHAALIKEVININSKLKPKIATIKEQINSLLKRKCIEKSTTNPYVYLYIA